MKNNKQTNPSQAEQPHNKPQQPQRSEQPKEGDIRKVTRSDEASAFDDEFEAEQEDSMNQEEADTEDENATANPRKGDTFNKAQIPAGVDA